MVLELSGCSRTRILIVWNDERSNLNGYTHYKLKARSSSFLPFCESTVEKDWLNSLFVKNYVFGLM